MKTLFLLIAVLLAACGSNAVPQQGTQAAASVTRMRFHCDSDTIVINHLLKAGIDCGINDANRLVEFYARRLLGTPYVPHTLEGDDEQLTINIHELDCTTFVETLYALARTTLAGRASWRDYAANLEDLRYRGGRMVDYSSRLHYISDWIIDNHTRGNMRELTPDLPHADFMVKNIDFMSKHTGSYRQLRGDSVMVEKIKRVEAGYRNHRMPYLKRAWLNDKAVKEALRAGDFVGLVTRVEGLDVSHMGIIVVDDKGNPHLLDASMSGGKVMIEEQTLFKYLERSKSNIGVRIFRMMQ